jgi:hypothetical protein
MTHDQADRDNYHSQLLRRQQSIHPSTQNFSSPEAYTTLQHSSVNHEAFLEIS